MIVGDVFHSRVARSRMRTCSRSFGADVVFCGPARCCAGSRCHLAPGVDRLRDLDDAIHGADVVMTLRVQKERLAGMQINVDEYIAAIRSRRSA